MGGRTVRAPSQLDQKRVAKTVPKLLNNGEYKSKKHGNDTI